MYIFENLFTLKLKCYEIKNNIFERQLTNSFVLEKVANILRFINIYI